MSIAKGILVRLKMTVAHLTASVQRIGEAHRIFSRP